jgi:hypothetical protein
MERRLLAVKLGVGRVNTVFANLQLAEQYNLTYQEKPASSQPVAPESQDANLTKKYMIDQNNLLEQARSKVESNYEPQNNTVPIKRIAPEITIDDGYMNYLEEAA